MNKKIVVLSLAALTAAPVFAQSSVTVSGFFRLGYDNYRLSNAGSFSAENRLTDASSRIIFSGKEDLGGGLSAFFLLDNRTQPDMGKDGSGASYVGGNVGVGLESTALGKVSFGRYDLHYNEGTPIEATRALSDQWTQTHGLLGTVNGQKIALISRSDNVIKYDSPSFSGFNATVAYSFNPAGNEGSGAANGSKGGAYQLAGRYVNGPINAGVSYWDYDIEGGAKIGDQVATRGWISYTLPFGLKLGLALDQSKYRNTLTHWNKRTAWTLPVSYSFGAHAIYAQYGRAGNVSDAANTSATQWSLGYDYALSKRTAVGVGFTKLNNASAATYDFKAVEAGKTVAGTATGNGQDARQFWVGIHHSF